MNQNKITKGIELNRRVLIAAGLADIDIEEMFEPQRQNKMGCKKNYIGHLLRVKARGVPQCYLLCPRPRQDCCVSKQKHLVIKLC